MQTRSAIAITPLAFACLVGLSGCSSNSDVAQPSPSSSIAAPGSEPSNVATVSTPATPEPTEQTPSVTTPESAPVVAAEVDRETYSAGIPGSTLYGFVTPSGKWICTIEPKNGRTRCASNPSQGPIGIPGAPARVAGQDGSSVTATVIEVKAGSDPDFAGTSQTIYYSESGPAKVLPYNSTLTVGAFSCNVQMSGISCRDNGSGKGFTFNDAGYSFSYTPAPGGR